jgi:hypothetical protein
MRTPQRRHSHRPGIALRRASPGMNRTRVERLVLSASHFPFKRSYFGSTPSCLTRSASPNPACWALRGLRLSRRRSNGGIAGSNKRGKPDAPTGGPLSETRPLPLHSFDTFGSLCQPEPGPFVVPAHGEAWSNVITKEVERPVPSLRSAPVIGAALELRDNYLGTLLRAARDGG